jgi:hypothetical protein
MLLRHFLPKNNLELFAPIPVPLSLSAIPPSAQNYAAATKNA